MAALPKKKASKRRTHIRRRGFVGSFSLSAFVKCKKCQKEKLPHTACPHCGFYKEYQPP